MFVVGFAIWAVFCIRDYLLIRTFLTGELTRRIVWYAAVTFTAALLWSLALFAAGTHRSFEVVFSPPFLVVAASTHALTAGVCFWLPAMGRFEVAWRVVVVPLPASWIALALALNQLHLGSSRRIAVSIMGFTVAWLAAILVRTRMRKADVPSDEDAEFSLHFAGWTNCMFLCLAPFIRAPPD
jgi:hypothetical protein